MGMGDIRVATTGDLGGLLALYRELRPLDPELGLMVARQQFEDVMAAVLI